MTTLGLIDPVTSKLIDFRPNDTVYLSEDGILKGLRITSAAASSTKLATDIVFVIDNSSSMDAEANSIADKIIAFANLLKALDVHIGIVGQNGKITGAINLGPSTDVEGYLKRSNTTGTARTKGFANTTLETAAKTAPSSASENGIPGVLFAEKNFAWRTEAARVFVNVTDESTQPGSNKELTTKALCTGWNPLRGTIPTIWSGPTLSTTKWTEGSSENPADLSTCTPGGVVLSVKSDASDLDLTTLPMTEALRNTSLLEFVSSDVSKTHEVVLTVKNGTTADGKTTYSNLKYPK